MKKKFLTFTLIFLIICALAIAGYFMFMKPDIKKIAICNTSEIGEECFSAENGMAGLKILTGQREKDYVLNGIHTENKDFALVIFRTDELNVESPTYIIKINGVSYNGILEQNPYDNTFVADLEIKIPNNSEILATIAIKNTEYEFELENISNNWSISFEEAREIGINELMEDLKLLMNGNDLNCEIYVKAITDTKGTLNSYFYHVSYIDKNGKSKGVVIDVNSGEVIN